MRTLKEKQKAQSRERILKAASKLFREKGFHATGVDELMEEAGLTAGAFYAHFKSKKELLDESLRFSLKSNRGKILDGTEGLRGEEFIRTVLGRYVSSAHRDQPKAGCPLPSIGPELPRHSKKTSETVSDYLEKWVQIMIPHLTGSEVERRDRALRLLSQAVGAVLLSRMTLNESLSDEILSSCRKGTP